MKNKKLALLLCLMLVVCVCAICACDFLAIPKFGHTHEYVEHQEIPATCSQKGCEKYYSCQGCDKLFDADKHEITAIPEIETLAHEYVEHQEIPATCSQKGCEKYYSCQGCDKLFDADKHEITAIPEIEMLAHELEYKLNSDGSKHYQQCKNCTYATNEVAHDYAWIQGEGVATLTCQCGKEVLTCKTTLAEADRLLVDAWGESFDIDLSKFVEGLSAKKVLLGQTEGVLTQQQNVATVTTSSLFNEQNANGNCELSLVVSYEGIDLTVTLPVKVACVVDSVAKLERLAYTAGIDHTSVGATLDENKKVVTQTLYVLTADIDGYNSRTEEYTEYEPATTPADIAKAGFRGIFDGQGHTIKNIVVGANGIFGHLGQDAVIANVTFDSITLDGQDVCLLGKAMDCSLENVDIQNIVIDSGRTNANMGVLFGQQVFSVDFANVTFDASSYNQSLTLIARNFDGGVDGEEWDYSKFQDVTVKAIYGVNGLNFYNDAPVASASGLTVEYNPFTIAMPVADESEYYYTGNEIIYKIAESSLYAVTGNKQTEIGVYTVTVSLTEPAASWEGAEEGKEKEPLTFSFEIKEMTEQIAQQLASEFAGKVTALGEIQLPRDKFAVESLLAEYEVSHANVKALLTSEKATLDGYKAQADKWTALFDETALAKYFGNSVAGGENTIGLNVVASSSGGYIALIANPLNSANASSYDKVVFYVYNPTDSAISGYINDWQEGNYNINFSLASKAWTKIEFKDHYIRAGLVNNYFYVEAQGLVFSNLFGMVDEQAAQAVVELISALPEESAITLDDKAQVVAARNAYNALGSTGKALVTNYNVLTACEAKIKELTPSGGGIVTALSVNGKVVDADYGNVLATSAASAGYFEAWGTMSKAQIEALSEYEGVHFYIYNPCEVAVNFFFQDNSAWHGHDNTSLAPKAWTKVTLSDVFNWAEGATIVYVDVDKNAEGFVGEGWMISDFFGYESSPSNLVETSLKIGQMTDSGTTGEHGTIYNLKQGQWYIDTSDTGTMHDFTTNSLANALPNNCSTLTFWMYNPTDSDLNVHLGGTIGGNWIDSANTKLVAKSWTQVIITATEIEQNASGTWYMYLSNSNAEGWQITAIFGVVAD